MLCKTEEDTLSHLFCSCVEARRIWDFGAIMFQRWTDRENPTNLITQWLVEPFQNPILNKSWELFPGILMWNLWKERNRQIFKQNPISIMGVWTKIKENIQESITAST
jgi:hypothetical protein